MVLVFDLDDTLYDERTYVRSGFQAVARFGHDQFGWDSDESLSFMMDLLDREGRGAVFDGWLRANGRYSRAGVARCLQVYRRHSPDISLSSQARELLPRLSGIPLYLVTDGNKNVQAAKVAALGIADRFRRVLITHRFGTTRAKPSTYCFERIRDREKCSWEAMVHVADNPAKDFVGLNPLGVRTVRVLTGGHRAVEAKVGYDARYTIEHLGELLPLLHRIDK